MMRFEQVVLKQHPDLVMVYGDVNSTVAAALVCAKLRIPVSHVEAGLRSFDRTMPEEINRVVTDQVADLLFTPSPDGNENLQREGVSPKKIHLVGNVMIDTLTRLLPLALEHWGVLQSRFNLDQYALVTLHRPSNVDEPDMLREIIRALVDISHNLPVIFSVHPRTRQRITDSDLQRATCKLQIIEPLGYLNFLALQQHATLVITDSGGIQEESTFLGIPCLTVRENTERPVTVTLGTNILVGQNMDRLRSETMRILEGGTKHGLIPPLWDGYAAERIADIVVKEFQS
jgi:UDP-N-acetylglucosamine 2-epimerase (non-hydrolysing)